MFIVGVQSNWFIIIFLFIIKILTLLIFAPSPPPLGTFPPPNSFTSVIMLYVCICVLHLGCVCRGNMIISLNALLSPSLWTLSSPHSRCPLMSYAYIRLGAA
ncbi:rCG60050 [Rattus norvegicus]|uniref:RCG60050 n=1 Tax=Rattus norvegicus TaxID=10116 RepID=A6HSY4_RAT|nr:rCG60050 [Rattus norvegicus]